MFFSPTVTARLSGFSRVPLAGGAGLHRGEGAEVVALAVRVALLVLLLQVVHDAAEARVVDPQPPALAAEAHADGLRPSP